MDDRKLLELSAKAYGISVDYRQSSNAFYYDDDETGREEWYPLGNHVQALRMEIKLRLDVVAFAEEWHVTKRIGGKTFSGVHADRQRATTMCAAEIGKTL